MFKAFWRFNYRDVTIIGKHVYNSCMSSKSGAMLILYFKISKSGTINRVT